MSEENARAPATSPAPTASADAERVESREDFLKWLFSKTTLSHNEQRVVRTLAIELLQSGRNRNQVDQAIIRFLRKGERILEEEAQANRKENTTKAEAEYQDQRERREAELLASENRLTVELTEARQKLEARKRAQEREADRHQQEMQDRDATRARKREVHEQEMRAKETEREDTSKERKTIVSLNKLIVISTIAMAASTLFLVMVAAIYQQPWAYAGTGVGLALTSVLGFGKISQQFQTLFALAKSGSTTIREVASDTEN